MVIVAEPEILDDDTILVIVETLSERDVLAAEGKIMVMEEMKKRISKIRRCATTSEG